MNVRDGESFRKSFRSVNNNNIVHERTYYFHSSFPSRLDAIHRPRHSIVLTVPNRFPLAFERETSARNLGIELGLDAPAANRITNRYCCWPAFRYAISPIHFPPVIKTNSKIELTGSWNSITWSARCPRNNAYDPILRIFEKEDFILSQRRRIVDRW